MQIRSRRLKGSAKVLFMEGAKQIKKEEILKKIEKVYWYHKFEVLPGIITPGRFHVNAKEVFDIYGIPKTLHGLKALDIGTWDGPYAFELENRGASVTAFDIQDPNCTGFNIAKEIRRSNVRYIQASVYNLSEVLREKFDIICFFGVYYHLKYPLLAFEQIHAVLSDDGLLLIEGECLRNYVETLDGQSISAKPRCRNKVAKKIRCFVNHRVSGIYKFIPNIVKKCYRNLFSKRSLDFVATMADSDIPLTLFYPEKYKNDSSNWFIPNLACLRSWLLTSALELKSYHFYENFPHQRMRGIVKKIKDRKIIPEHALVKKKNEK